MLTKSKMFAYSCTAVIIAVTPVEASSSPEPPDPCDQTECRIESETDELEQPRLLKRPILSARSNQPKPPPFAPLTGRAVIHSPADGQIVGETFRIHATLPSDWFLDGAARGRVFYFDVPADRFVVISEFLVPASPDQDMQSIEDKTVDFETTAAESDSRLFTLELSQAAPPDGFRPYNVSTFIEVRPGQAICIDRYCLEENIDLFEASLSDLTINASDSSGNFLKFNAATYRRSSSDQLGTKLEWIDVPNAFEMISANFDLTYTQSFGTRASISLTNRLYDAKRKECEAHFVDIAEQIEADFGPLSANKRWVEWARSQGEKSFGTASKYLTYKDGKDRTYSSVRNMAASHTLSVETRYSNENGYIACISEIRIEPDSD